MQDKVKLSKQQNINTSSELNKSNKLNDTSSMPKTNTSNNLHNALQNPEYLTHDMVMQLQSTIGNQAVIHLCNKMDFINISSKSHIVKNSEEKPLQMKKENNTGLPDNLKAGIENLSGISMDNVKVHYNSSKPTQVGALAYAQGTDIYVASGQEKHLPHEAWHVVQQKQGRVKPLIQLKGLSVNNDSTLEKEADIFGEMAAKSGSKYMDSSSIKKNISNINCSKDTLQLEENVCNVNYYKDPKKYIEDTFKEKRPIFEDSGSGGILDEPMQNLVRHLIDADGNEKLIKNLERFAAYEESLKQKTQSDQVLTTFLQEKISYIYDFIRIINEPEVFYVDTAYDTVKKNTLKISKYIPGLLSIHRPTKEFNQDKKIKEDDLKYTFHKDHGYVKLTEDDFKDTRITDPNERKLRLKIANGPWERGWVRGHGGIDQKEHRFIEHVHVNKDDTDDKYKVNIFNTNDSDDLTTALNFDTDCRIHTDHNKLRDSIIEAAEGAAHDTAFKIFKTTLDSES